MQKDIKHIQKISNKLVITNKKSYNNFLKTFYDKPANVQKNKKIEDWVCRTCANVEECLDEMNKCLNKLNKLHNTNESSLKIATIINEELCMYQELINIHLSVGHKAICDF